MPTPAAVRVWLLVLPTLAVASSLASAQRTTSTSHVVDLNGRTVDVLAGAADAKATVVVFTLSDCPISNRFAPELRRLDEQFSRAGVRFYLAYVNPRETAESVREHLEKFAYTMEVVRDPAHELVKIAGATVSPEAAVFDSRGQLAYRGRIDDRFVTFGVDRPAPTRRDLEDAVTALVRGYPVSVPRTQAVGCYLADLVP